MKEKMRAPNTTSYNSNDYDNSNRNSAIDQDDISKKSEETPYDGADVEKVDSHRRGSAVFRATMSEDSSYKVLNRYQASLIYITNQVGLGILSLPTAMQTLGLVPGIITIIGMGTQNLLICMVHMLTRRSLCRCPRHVHSLCLAAILQTVPNCAQLC